MRRRKLEVVRKLLKDSDISCIQEAHAAQVEFERELADQRDGYVFCVSSHADRCTGGLIVAIRKRLLGSRTDVQMRERIPGRVVEVVVVGDGDGAEIRVVNPHNFDIGWGEARFLEGWATQRPLERLGLLCGDWNTIPDGETAMGASGAPTRGGREWRGPLHDAVSRSTEIVQPSPTYIAAVGGYMARLDRAQ